MARIAIAIGVGALGFFLFGPFGPAAIQALSIGGTFATGLTAASVGLAAGSALGNALFPIHLPGQFGPRLNDLLVGGSSPGAFIPFGYGKNSFGGQIIWSPGLKEHKTTTTQSGGGKGGPTITNTSYTYTADMAVAWGEGVGSISKIWGDVKVLYDSGSAYVSFAGDFNNTQTYAIGDVVKYSGKYYQAQLPQTSLPSLPPTIPPFGALFWIPYSGAIPTVSSPKYPPPVLYSGTSTQMPDPTVQAALGVNNTPAFRNIIYAVWTGLLLTDFGNRIPNLRAVVNFGSVGTQQPLGILAGSVNAYAVNSTSNGGVNIKYGGSVGNPVWAFGDHGHTVGAPAPISQTWLGIDTLNWEGNTGQNTQFFHLTNTGQRSGSIDSGHYENWEAMITFTIVVNNAGGFPINLSHDDGAFFACKSTTEDGGTVTVTGGSLINTFWATSAYEGYPLRFGNNNSNTHPVDGATLNISGGSYPTTLKCEINWTNWEHHSRMIFTFNDGLQFVDISGSSSTNTTSVSYIVKDICVRSGVDESLIDVTDLVS